MSALVWTSEAKHVHVTDDRPYVKCRQCGYERPALTPCGEPCV